MVVMIVVVVVVVSVLDEVAVGSSVVYSTISCM